MPKGIRKQLSLAEEIIDLDRVLLTSVRRNVALAERMSRETPDTQVKADLEKFLVKHVLRKDKEQDKPPETMAKPMSEKDRRLERCSRLLPSLSDPNLHTLLEILKSMNRQDAAAQGAGRATDTGKGGRTKRKGQGASEGNPPSSEPSEGAATA